MDIKELDKKQLILLTLLITFVVSIATGIVTVSLMNQLPKSVPQTINNVIQRTIEKVTTVQVPTTTFTPSNTTNNQEIPENSSNLILGSDDALVSIYQNNTNEIAPINPVDGDITTTEPNAIGQGIIISDIGLILVDSSLILDQVLYKVTLDKTDFDVSILKRFNNGFTVLKLSPIESKIIDTANKPQ